MTTSDFYKSAVEANSRNADMRGDRPYTTQPRTPAETAEFLKYNPPAEPTLEQIHRRLNAENIDLRGQLDMARKATSAAQELLEAERQKNAALSAELTDAKEARQISGGTVVEYIGRLKELRNTLDTEKLLRVNDAGTIADLQRRLCEAEGQLKARRLSAENVAEIRAYEPRWAIDAKKRAEVVAENTELHKTIESQEVTIRQLKAQIETMPVTVRGEPTVARKMLEAELEEMRRTFRLIVGTTKEYFDLITELASDPADEKRKEPKP